MVKAFQFPVVQGSLRRNFIHCWILLLTYKPLFVPCSQDQLVLPLRLVTSAMCIVMEKVQFSHLTVKLVSHKCHLWFRWRWCNGYICLAGKWEVENDGVEVC